MVSPAKCIAGRSVADWIAAYPVVSDLCALKETAWVNPDKLPFAQAVAACPLTLADIEDAAARLERFAPYLAAVFPETAAAGAVALISPGKYGSSWTVTCLFPAPSRRGAAFTRC